MSIDLVYRQLNVKTVPFQTAPFSVRTQYTCQNSHISSSLLIEVCSLNIKTVLFQVIQFRIGTQFISIWPINRSLSGATTPGKSGPGSDCNDGVLLIPQSSSVTGTLPSDCLVSVPEHFLRESFSSAEMLPLYSTAPANWVRGILKRLHQLQINTKS